MVGRKIVYVSPLVRMSVSLSRYICANWLYRENIPVVVTKYARSTPLWRSASTD
jgi:hypothetical protein